MKTVSVLFFAFALIASMLMVEANLLLKSNGKKHKDLILLGKKCEPTIIKSGDKKGKHGQTLIMNPDCHEKKKYELIPIPVMYHDYPEYIHEQSYGSAYGGYGNGYSMGGFGHGAYGDGGHGYNMGGYGGGYGGGEGKSYYSDDGYYK